MFALEGELSGRDVEQRQRSERGTGSKEGQLGLLGPGALAVQHPYPPVQFQSLRGGKAKQGLWRCRLSSLVRLKQQKQNKTKNLSHLKKAAVQQRCCKEN